jgi:hypothetical protein
MTNKIILIPPNPAYGDCLSVIGLLYYLLEYYDLVFFHVPQVNHKTNAMLNNYFTEYFKHEPLYNCRIFVIDNSEQLINEGVYNEYHICNSLANWAYTSFMFFNPEKLDEKYYFNNLNPLYNQLDIPEEHKSGPHSHSLPNFSVGINHVIYYKLIGLNNNVRMNYFHYSRNVEKEVILKNELLKNVGSKYNIINDPIGVEETLKKHIHNNYPTININYLSSCPGDLLTLIEGAESIHLVEGCNVNFLYHCAYKNIFNYDNKIHFHVWLRNRHWLVDNTNMDYAWKMMDTPRLDNWLFHF